MAMLPRPGLEGFFCKTCPLPDGMRGHLLGVALSGEDTVVWNCSQWPRVRMKWEAWWVAFPVGLGVASPVCGPPLRCSTSVFLLLQVYGHR